MTVGQRLRRQERGGNQALTVNEDHARRGVARNRGQHDEPVSQKLVEHPVENVLVSEAAAHKALIRFSFCTHGILDRSMRDQTNSLAALLKVHVLRRGITKPFAVLNPGRWSRSAG